MVDIASLLLGSFQDSLVSVFGTSIGWSIGHLILLAGAGLAILALKERRHIISNSGFNMQHAWDGIATLLVTIFLFFIYTSIFEFEPVASLGISLASSISLRWMITILG